MSETSPWNKVLLEINSLTPQPGQPSPFDVIRQRKMQTVFGITGRPLIVYAVACTLPGKLVPPQVLQMDFSDKLAFHDVSENLHQYKQVDVLLHSGGGLAEAAEALVELLRKRFNHVRFIIPIYAKSAATMLALSGDEILMAPDAELGPTDPQMVTPHGIAPAQAVIDQFEKAKEALAVNPAELTAWAPILAQMGPSLLQQCQNALDLSKELVAKWLAQYMFKGDGDAEKKATHICEYLSNHNNFKSHARGVRLPLLRRLHVKATPFPSELVAPLWELYCAVDITLSNSAAVRLVENNFGTRIVRNHGPELSFGIQIPSAPPRLKPPTLPSPGQTVAIEPPS